MLQIGEFARLGGVSIKMLRHYDAVGLLAPSHVDSASGYRRYELAQLDRLRRIVALKDLGVPLAQIGRLLDDGVAPGQARELLESLRDEAEARLAAERARLDAIAALLRLAGEPGAAPGPIVRQAAPQLVASISAASGAPRHFERLETVVAGYGARANRPPMLICHAPGRVEVAVPVVSPIPAGQGIAMRETPGAAAALSVVHIGGYAGLPAARDSLLTVIAGRGLRQSGPLRVVYHRFGATCAGYDLDRACLAAHPGEYVTELIVPISTTHALPS